jgi:Fur family ferric uptake transcriptional regulator
MKGEFNLPVTDNSFLKQKLKEYGYKYTGQRAAVLDSLIACTGKHVSTEELFNLVKAYHPEIGLATVYRTVTLLEKLGLVHKLDFDDGFSRYELVKPNEDHRHHHLICTACGSVSEVEDDLLESLEEQILIKKGFLVKNHRVKFYGLCENCRNK